MLSSSKIRVEAEVRSPEEGRVESLNAISVNGDIFSDNARTMGMFGLSANLVNSVIGAGVLILPYSLGQVGLVTGLILLVIGAILAMYGLHLLAKVCVQVDKDRREQVALLSPSDDFETIVAKIPLSLSFGSVAALVHRFLPLIAGFLAFFNCIVMSVVYLNTFADFMVQVSEALTAISESTSVLNDVGDVWYLNRGYYLLMAVFVVVPLSIPKQVSVLKYTSTVAILCIIYTAGLVVGLYFSPKEKVCETFLEQNNATSCFTENCCLTEEPGSTCCRGTVELFSPKVTNVLSAFPSMMNSFACAPQFLAAFNSLINPTLKRMSFGTNSAIFLSLFLYLIISIFGYLTYGDNIASDLLSVYPLSVEVTIARFGIAIVVLTSYPLFMHVSRDSMILMIATILKKESFKDSRTKQGRQFYYAILFMLLGFSFAISALALDLDVLLNLVGTVAVSNLSFTLPGIFYLGIFRHDKMGCNKVGSIFLIVLGLVVMLANFVLWGL